MFNTIVEFTERVAADLAKQYESNPDGELLAWTKIALRREAMVAAAYGRQPLRRRLQSLAKEGVDPTIRRMVGRAIGSAWAQEESHTAFLRATVSNASAKLNERVSGAIVALQGRFEGAVLARALSQSRTQKLQARIAIAAGGKLWSTPAFVRQLDSMPMEKYLLFNAALEETAIRGYKHIGALIRQIASRDGVAPFHLSIEYDMKHTLDEERFHQALFEGMAAWFDGDRLSSGTSRESCERTLAQVVAEKLGTALDRKDQEPRVAKEQAKELLISHLRKGFEGPLQGPRVDKRLRDFNLSICFVGKPLFVDLVRKWYSGVIVISPEAVIPKVIPHAILKHKRRLDLYAPGIARNVVKPQRRTITVMQHLWQTASKGKRVHKLGELTPERTVDDLTVGSRRGRGRLGLRGDGRGAKMM